MGADLLKERRGRVPWVLGVSGVLCAAAGLFAAWVIIRGGPKPDLPTHSGGGGDTLLEEVDANMQAEAELLETKKRVPPHPWHSERNANISRESIEELVANLADYDDMTLASTSLGGGMHFGPDEPECVNRLLPRLFRVRQLLAIGREEPALVASKMREALRSALADWPEAFQHELALWREAGNMSLKKAEPTPGDRVRTRAETATYVLAELGSHESLPLLLESQRTQNRWIEEIPVEAYRHIAQTPVPPPTSLYAMHRLVSTMPQDGLSPEARALHRAYMEWAEKYLAPPEYFEGVYPGADYDESDPLLRMLDPQGSLVREEPKMRLAEYPAYFTDWERMQLYPAAPYVHDRSKEWFRLMEAFIETAFADSLSKMAPIVVESVVPQQLE